MIGEALLYLDDKLNKEAMEVHNMAVDQATFDTALQAFLNDLNAGLAAIQSKLDAAGAQVDLSAELAQIQNAQAAFDAQVNADTTTANAPAPAPAPAAPAEPTP